MSEEDNKPKPPAKPTTKTSTVPLKKETVRITLRAKPGAGTEAAGAPPAPPKPPAPKPPAPPSAAGAPKPPAPPSAAGAPKPPAPPSAAGAPKPPAPPSAAGAPKPPPAPAPPKPPGGAPPAPAPTIALTPAPPAGAPAPPPPAGAKTVPLTQAPAPSGPAVGAQTARLQSPPANAPGTRPLPKATVKLAPTQPIASAPTASIASTPIKGGVASQVLADDEAEEEGGIMPFAAIALVLAVAVLAIELLTSQRVFVQNKKGEPSFAVPREDNRYHKATAAGDLIPTFKSPKLPDYTPKSTDSPDIGARD